MRSLNAASSSSSWKDAEQKSQRVVQKIENYLSIHSKSKKICLDEKNKLRIHSRFLTKYHEGPNTQAHVCLIFDKHRCWYVGINSNREHAEVDALKQWLKYHHHSKHSKHSKQKKEKERRTWRMMVVRFSKTGIFNNSKPCFHCSSFLKKYSCYFHSISFSDIQEQLMIMYRHEFQKTQFSHVSRGHAMLLSSPSSPCVSCS